LELHGNIPDAAHGPEIAEWRLRLEDLPVDLRAEIRSLHAIRWWSNLVVVLYPALWVGAIVLMERFPAVPIRIAGVVVIAFCIQAMGSLMHEALHGNLFRHAFWDRWIGFLLAIPTLFSHSAYKVAHLNHHRHTRTEKDQDEFSYACRAHWQYVAVFYVSFLVGSLMYMVLVPVKALEMASRSNRQRILVDYSLMLACFAGAVFAAVWTHHAPWLLWYWLLPFLLAVLMANLRGLAEHMGTPTDGGALRKTRTTISNPVYSFLLLNLNYHLEHHLFPGVPWYNLPRIHQILLPTYQARGAVVERSYLMYGLKCLLRIPDPVERVTGRVAG
jgi:fatty acid desaturase